MGGFVNMRLGLLTSFLLFAWCPSSVLGDSYAVVVQTGGSVMKPGDVLNYVVSANPVPSWTLGMVLIQTVPDADGGAICWPWTITLASSPKQASIRIPSGVPPRMYTVDIHVNASIYSTKLATSNVFEVVSNAPPTTQAPTTNVVQTTRQTTIVTTQQTVVQQPPNSPQPQPDPTSQDPVVTNKPTITQNSPSNPSQNAPSSNAAVNSNAGPTSGQTGSTEPILMPSAQSAPATTTDTSPTHSADSSLNAPPTSEKKKSSAIGPAIGGAIGGIIVIIILLFLWRRHNNKKQGRIAIDEMAESNSRFNDGAASSATSPFANTFREFQPNRNNTAVSPFLLDDERSPPSTSPDPTMSSKYREAFGGGVGPSNQKHQQNSSVSASSASGAGGTSDHLRSERERALGEISALRSRGGQGSGSAYAQSSVSAGSSGGGRDAADEEIRNRLDMLTQHVARLENALGQGAYEAPPTYHQAPSVAPSQRG